MIKNRLTRLSFIKLWKTLGPGLITGASDDDPSALTTFSQAGASFGLSTLWITVLAFPVLAFIQEMCARIGIVTKMTLTGVVKRYYPKWVLYILLGLSCPAFIFNIGADISILGETGNLLFPKISPIVCSIAFTFLLFALMLLLPFKRLISVMKFVCLILLAYAIVPFFLHMQLNEILKSSFIPTFHCNQGFLLIIIGLIGSILSPYIFFWQTSTEAEALKATQIIIHSKSKKKIVGAMRADIISGAFFAVIIMYFVILTTGTVLYGHIDKISSIRDAAFALKPLSGNISFILFSLGIIGTSFLIIPVLSGSISFILTEACNWKTGFNKSFVEAKQFYIIIFIALCIGLSLKLLGIGAIKALLLTTVLYGIIAPFLIGIILHIVNNKKIMTNRYCNNKLSNAVGFISLIFMFFALSALCYTIFRHYFFE